MMVSGLVHDCRFRSCFTIIIKRKLVHFYLQRNLFKKFDKFLAPGTFVKFEIEDCSYTNNEIKYYKVTNFLEISNRGKAKKCYYSIDVFREGIKDLFNNLNNIVFIDFEFNMQDFYPIKNFIGEIIEVGYCLCDKKLNIIKQDNLFIKPTVQKKVTKRTVKFLNYSNDLVEKQEDYQVFYDLFKDMVDKYDPTFIVWGKSDIDSLKQSFKLNKVDEISFKFIDLSRIHVNYYLLNNTPGLFKTAEKYNNELPKQKHNALEDALVTKLVFSNFKESI